MRSSLFFLIIFFAFGAVASFAQGDQPVRSVGFQVGVAVVAGIGQQGADNVVGVLGDRVDACRCFLRCPHHRDEAPLVVG